MPYKLNHNIIENLIVITTHNTFSSEKFVKLIEKCMTKSMVIVDEAHGAGAKKSRQGLLNNYVYRLGLSATPKRYYDDVGTDVVLDYFGGVIFKYGP